MWSKASHYNVVLCMNCEWYSKTCHDWLILNSTRGKCVSTIASSSSNISSYCSRRGRPKGFRKTLNSVFAIQSFITHTLSSTSTVIDCHQHYGKNLVAWWWEVRLKLRIEAGILAYNIIERFQFRLTRRRQENKYCYTTTSSSTTTSAYMIYTTSKKWKSLLLEK